MSTRCVVNFCYKSKEDVLAKIYVHSDGYPDGPHGIPARLRRFFRAVEKATNDTRFDDPSYLAAKFVVWQAKKLAVKYNYSGGTMKQTPTHRLDFLGIGVLNRDPGDIAHRYFVLCRKFTNKNRPVVKHEPVR